MGAPKDSQQMTAMVRIVWMRRGLVRIFVRTENSDLASKSRIDIYHLTVVGTDTWGYNNLSNYGITPNQIISVLPYDSVTDGKYNVHDGCLNNKIVFEWYTNTTTNQLMMRNINGGSAIGAAVTVLIA